MLVRVCCDTQRSKRADDGEILSEYSEEEDASRKKKRARRGSESEEESGEEGGKKKKTKKRRRYASASHLRSYVLLLSKKDYIVNLVSEWLRQENERVSQYI